MIRQARRLPVGDRRDRVAASMEARPQRVARLKVAIRLKSGLSEIFAGPRLTAALSSR